MAREEYALSHGHGHGHGVGPGARTAHRAADLDLVQDRDEAGAVGGLPLGQFEGQRAAAPLGCEVDFAGQAAA